MQVPVMDRAGNQVKTIDLPADIFEVEVNKGLMHQAYVRQMANARLGTHKVKTRSEVKMTTAKWYRQKGTGRARHGAQSATQFVGGGQSHGPVPHKYTKDMPKKMRRQAIRCALSALIQDNQLVFVDDLTLNAPKTQEMAQIIQNLTKGRSALILLADRNENVERSANNLQKIKTLRASYLNIRDLLQYDKVIVPMDALDVITRIWSRENQ